jgi:nitrate/nitrite transport system substrate-binding protein
MHQDALDPYDADRPLLMRCSCGRHATRADHDAAGATAELVQRSASAAFEAESNAFVEAALV